MRISQFLYIALTFCHDISYQGLSKSVTCLFYKAQGIQYMILSNVWSIFDPTKWSVYAPFCSQSNHTFNILLTTLDFQDFLDNSFTHCLSYLNLSSELLLTFASTLYIIIIFFYFLCLFHAAYVTQVCRAKGVMSTCETHVKHVYGKSVSDSQNLHTHFTLGDIEGVISRSRNWKSCVIAS